MTESVQGYPDYETLSISRSGTILKLAFNRPARLNAVNAQMHTDLADVFARIAYDLLTDVVVLTGNGKAFCAGGDIDWFQAITHDELELLFLEGRKIVLDFLEIEQPIIAAVNGPATGLGASLALLSDIIIVSERAKIGDTHVKVGLVAGDGGCVIWPWLVGPAKAKQYLLTGDLLTGQEAAAMGLVNEVVAEDHLLRRAEEWAQRFVLGSQPAIRGTKVAVNKLLRESVNLNLDTAMARERRCFDGSDHRESLAAFKEGRLPRFSDR